MKYPESSVFRGIKTLYISFPYFLCHHGSNPIGWLTVVNEVSHYCIDLLSNKEEIIQSVTLVWSLLLLVLSLSWRILMHMIFFKLVGDSSDTSLTGICLMDSLLRQRPCHEVSYWLCSSFSPIEPWYLIQQSILTTKSRHTGQVSGDLTSYSSCLILSTYFLHHSLHRKMVQYIFYFLAS